LDPQVCSLKNVAQPEHHGVLLNTIIMEPTTTMHDDAFLLPPNCESHSHTTELLESLLTEDEIDIQKRPPPPLSSSSSSSSSSLERTIDTLQKDSMTSVLQDLWKLLTDTTTTTEEKEKPTEDDLDQFRLLIQSVYPLYRQGKLQSGMDPKNTHLLQEQLLQQLQQRYNMNMNMPPLSLIHSFVHSLQSLTKAEQALTMTLSERSIQMIESLSIEEQMEILLYRMLSVKQAEKSRDVTIFYNVPGGEEEDGGGGGGGGCSEEEAVEVDWQGGDVELSQSNVTSDMLADSEPWWEAADRLAKEAERRLAIDEYNMSMNLIVAPSASLDEFSDDLTTTCIDASIGQPRSVDEDIKEFWLKQNRPGVTRRTRRTNHAIHDRIDNLLQLGTHESSRRTRSGRSMDTQEEKEWVRKRSYALWPKKDINTKLQTLLNGGNVHVAAHIPVDAPKPINAVTAVRLLDRPKVLRSIHNNNTRTRVPGTKQWKRPYAARTRPHEGFFHIDVHSLHAASSSALQSRPHPLDSLPWEHRHVKQRFLFEQSISYSRNWFGIGRKVYGNDKIVEPICFPRSMEMPTRAESWTEEWYAKPWPTTTTMSGSNEFEEELCQLRKKYNTTTQEEEEEEDYDDDDDESSWISADQIPQCGRLCTVKLKIGERVSRVTPDLTSSLRRSRWRKTYFPKGTFPY
jgi:hypothetical protein